MAENHKAASTSRHGHPVDELREVAKELGLALSDVKFAREMDSRDPLKHLRDEFHYCKMKDIHNADLSLVNPSEECIYMCGNSLGLCPKNVKKYMDVEIDKWAKIGVQGHMNGDLPWAWCEELLEEDMAKIVGCQREEVCLMNGLTVNLHLLMISFYRPTAQRYKILFEGKAFPSDHYAFESHAELHGFDPKDVLICMEPREGERTLRTEDILALIEREGHTIAVICFSGVQYYTGQLFDIPTITTAGQAKGCAVGWDLAHAAGNVPLSLHEWGVDFACWCTYKYLCSGAGAIAGLFIHEKHRVNDFPRLKGWWSHEFKTRFVMDNKMVLSPGARGYRISNASGFQCAVLKASLEVFSKTNMEELRRKSLLLTAYLEALIQEHFQRPKGGKSIGDDGKSVYVDIFTPSDPMQRGAQLSMSFSISIEQTFKELAKRGVICDKRLPDVIRVAPTPAYNRFEDVHRFLFSLIDALKAAQCSE